MDEDTKKEVIKIIERYENEYLNLKTLMNECNLEQRTEFKQYISNCKKAPDKIRELSEQITRNYWYNTTIRLYAAKIDTDYCKIMR